MKIHETHQMEPGPEYDGKVLERCAACGGVADEALAPPCPGQAPELEIHDDGEVIQIIWSFPEGGVKSSTFPQMLVTVDYALDKRPIGVVFAGARARELRRALGDDANAKLMRVTDAWDRWVKDESFDDPFPALRHAIEGLRGKV